MFCKVSIFIFYLQKLAKAEVILTLPQVVSFYCKKKGMDWNFHERRKKGKENALN